MILNATTYMPSQEKQWVRTAQPEIWTLRPNCFHSQHESRGVTAYEKHDASTLYSHLDQGLIQDAHILCGYYWQLTSKKDNCNWEPLCGNFEVHWQVPIQVFGYNFLAVQWEPWKTLKRSLLWLHKEGELVGNSVCTHWWVCHRE